MSGYHFHLEFVSRGSGQSVVAKGAYHARAEFREERTGDKKDYTYKQDRPVWSGVFVDKDAPASFHQNESLLNEIDRREVRKDAQTALNITLALPEKLTDEERQRMLRDFGREEFSRKHLAAVAHIHRPSQKGDDRNHHAHILIATRTAGPQGFGEKFVTRENYSQHLKHWREKWAELGARYLEKAGHKLDADRWREGHRTLEQQRRAALERGDTAYAETLNREATRHRGPAVDAMERKGQQTERGNAYRDTLQQNGKIATLRQELAAVQSQIIQTQQQLNLARIDRLLAAVPREQVERVARQLENAQAQKQRPGINRSPLQPPGPAPQIRRPGEPSPADPWMAQRGGVERLSPAHLESARRSYDAWTLKHRYGFENYVSYVQRKWEEKPEQRERLIRAAERAERGTGGGGISKIFGSAVSAAQDKTVLDRAERRTMANERAASTRELRHTVLDRATRRTMENERAAGPRNTRDR